MSREGVNIALDLTQRVGTLHHGNIDLIKPPSLLRVDNIRRITRDFYSRITDTQTSPFSALGESIKIGEDEDKLSKRVLLEAKKENNSPSVQFATIYVRAVERALTRPKSIAIYDQGFIHIRHPLGFFAIYSPTSAQSFENLLLIVPAAPFDGTGILDKNDSVIYIFNPNANDNTRLTAYIRKRVKNKHQTHPFYKDQSIPPLHAKQILKAVRDRMDQQGGVLSPVQTPLE